MKRVLLGFTLLGAAATTVPLHAETYKWVDEKGVVNYSNTLPPSTAKPVIAKVVEDRISVVSSDPLLAQAVAAMRAQSARNAEYAQTEWLQRQRNMIAAQAYQPMAEPDYDPMYGYGYGYSYPLFIQPARVVKVRRVPHVAPRRSVRSPAHHL